MTKRPATASRRPPRASAPALLEPSIQVESFSAIADELAPLFVRFWKENGRDGVPLDPDWVSLLRMTAAGLLRVVTARQDGALVGFILNIVGPHLMYHGTCHGTTIDYWLDPICRAGWFPVKFLRRNVELLREWGAKRAFIAADAGYKDGRAGKLFERLGYAKHEVHYARML
jgi:GNAT superfamily N-acetyltransferase